MIVLSVYSDVMKGTYNLLKEVPSLISNTAKGCYQYPGAIPAFATSLILAGGGAALASRSMSKASECRKTGHHLKSMLHSTEAYAAGMTSVVGAVSTLNMSLYKSQDWKDVNISIIKYYANNVYNPHYYAFKYASEIPRLIYAIGKIVVRIARNDPIYFSCCTLSLGFTGVTIMATKKCKNIAIEAFQNNELKKSLKYTSFTLVAAVGTAINVCAFALLIINGMFMNDR